MYTEEKAKVVAAVWRTEFVKFLANLHQDDIKKQIIAPGGFEEIYDLHKDGFKSSWCIIHTLASQCHFSL